jgi:hypothetical protein
MLPPFTGTLRSDTGLPFHLSLSSEIIPGIELTFNPNETSGVASGIHSKRHNPTVHFSYICCCSDWFNPLSGVITTVVSVITGVLGWIYGSRMKKDASMKKP